MDMNQFRKHLHKASPKKLTEAADYTVARHEVISKAELQLDRIKHAVLLKFRDGTRTTGVGKTKEEAIESAKLRYPNQSLATYKSDNINGSIQNQRATQRMVD